MGYMLTSMLAVMMAGVAGGVAPVGVDPVGVAPVGVASVGVTQVGVTPVGVAPVGVAPVSVAQAPCCWVGTWRGTLTQRLGVYDRTANYASLIDVLTHTSVSGVRQRVYNEVTSRNGSTAFHLKVLNDFKNGVTYTVVNGYCVKTKLTDALHKSCVPANASYLGSHKFAGIVADTWVVAPPFTPVSYATTRITVARKRCAPLHTTELTFNDKSRMSFTTFGNLSDVIPDPSVFDVPAVCNTTLTFTDEKHLVQHVPHQALLRRTTLF